MRKVVIIGAGHVGSHCGYTLAHSGITDEIVLVDVDKDRRMHRRLILQTVLVSVRGRRWSEAEIIRIVKMQRLLL